MNRRAIAMLIVAITLMSAASPVMAQTPTSQGYDESQILGEISDTPPSHHSNSNSHKSNSSSESLPFTGLDLGIVALMGAGLLGTGVAIRRSAATRPQ